MERGDRKEEKQNYDLRLLLHQRPHAWPTRRTYIVIAERKRGGRADGPLP